MAQANGDVHEQKTGWGVETTMRDIRYGCRTLVRTPGFAAVIVLTLAMAVGANVTMFSVMYGVLWRSLPYPDPDRLVFIEADLPSVANAGLATGEVRDIRERSPSLELVSTIVGVDRWARAACAWSDSCSPRLQCWSPWEARRGCSLRTSGFWFSSGSGRFTSHEGRRSRWMPSSRCTRLGSRPWQRCCAGCFPRSGLRRVEITRL